MTSSRGAPATAFVWIWLPGAEEPIVAGRVDQRADQVVFGYGNSYRARSDAISIYERELPLAAGPDSWGQRVILNQLLGPAAIDNAELSRLTYLVHSGSDRIGALDFQAS